MSKKKLVIVESPAKIKTLRKFLGPEYVFESSIGHIRDLPQKDFGVNIEKDFEPTYVTMPDKKDVIANLKKQAAKADVVYLAPDPDREGEAIAWHIAQILPKDTHTLRTSFHSITKNAVTEAIENPRQIDMSLVDAQQARRILDRMVGYSISPILTRRVKRGRSGTSAGRVQSVALKFVVDREKEIEAFVPVEYWTLRAFLSDDGKEPFESYLHSVDGKKVEKEKESGYLINNEQVAQTLFDRAKQGKYTLAKIEKKEKKRNAPPPFITSTLQQEAARHYGYQVSRTMSIAQQLYEGIDLGSAGAEGLITYMRTDSVQIAPVALNAARKHIEKEYGKDYLPEKANVFKSKKAAQEAHEAIRPTNLAHPPELVRSYLTEEQFKIYLLIFRRFIASQMTPAIYDTVSYDINTDNGLMFRANGSVLKFKGYLQAYEEKTDGATETDQLTLLPEVKEGQELFLKDLTKTQSFTKPPPRYTEPSLVKELEKSGIGRPSTYASIMNKIQSREYTTKENKALKPTELGKVIAEMLETNFNMIMDVGFTAEMEDELELVAEGKKKWRKLIKEFWDAFSPLVDKAEKEAVVPKQETDLVCPKCQGKVHKIWSKTRYFYGCENYPDCDYTTTDEALSFNKEDYDPDFNWDQKCPNCEAEMTLRHGRFGPFLGCSKYPDCKGIVNIPKKGEETLKPEDRPDCPAIGCDGKIMMRKSRFGKTFFSCSNYPDCDVIVNDLDQLTEKYVDHPKTAYVKKTKKKATKKTAKKTTKKKTTKKATKKTTRKMPSYKLSKEMAAVCKEDTLTRAEVLKKIWEYIRENNCQDPKNKRIIVPDEKLALVFKTKEPVDMMKIAGFIKDHLIKE